MENAVDAMKMAFAMLVFVAALSLTMFSFTQVRQTSQTITQEADTREYYDKLSLESANSVNKNSSRIVGSETIIPTLYRAYKENYTVLFYQGSNYKEDTGEFSKIEPIVIYHTESMQDSQDDQDDAVSKSSLITDTDTRGVFGIDPQDEQARQEPWLVNEESTLKFIDALINASETERYHTTRTTSATGEQNNQFGRDENGPYYTINFNGTKLGKLINSTSKFVERYGEYNRDNIANDSDDSDSFTGAYINSTITDSVVELDNGEIVTKRNQTTKRVIQYILIN